MRLPGVQEEVYSSSFAAATYLRAKRFSKKVYVVGEEGLVEELEAVSGLALPPGYNNDIRPMYHLW